MKAFLTGLGVGIGLGVLFAPRSGEETRNRVREKVGDWSESFSEQADNMKRAGRQAKEAVASAAEGVGRGGEAVSRRKEPVSESSQDLINTISREELMNVNGIGTVLADRIISERPFRTRRDLVERGILSPGTYQELERELGKREARSA